MQFIVNLLKQNKESLFSNFLCKSAKIIPFVAACNKWNSRKTYEQRANTHFYFRSVALCLYWDHGQGALSAKYKEPQRIGHRRWAAKSRTGQSLDSDVIADLSCIYGGGLISTLFPSSHTSRCNAGRGGKRVALFWPGWWALESCASASPEEGSTSHSHWERHKDHLFYIKSVRLNTEVNNPRCLRRRFSQISCSAADHVTNNCF